MILDMTCAQKQMWFQKEYENAVYIDIRNGTYKYKTVDKPDFQILPDIQCDNKKLPFKDNCFSMVVFDPPHVIGKSRGVFYEQYGYLDLWGWQKQLYDAIKEGFRVLKKDGFFVFKWSERNRALQRVLTLFPSTPLFGSKIGTKQTQTFWIVWQK